MDLILLLLDLEHPDNSAEVGELLAPIVERDIITPETQASDLAALEQLKALGEQKLYDKVLSMVQARG